MKAAPQEGGLPPLPSPRFPLNYLGNKLKKPMPAFAITNDLNWTVSNRAVASMNFKGEWVPDPKLVAVHRDDTDARLGYVSANYETVQNESLHNLISPMVSEGVLSIANQGYLQNGARVFIQASLNEEFRVVGEDYRAMITLLNGHVGNASVAIGPTATRVICGNTFAMAYSDIGEKFRHSEGVNERILESSAVVDFVNTAMKKYSESVETIAKSTCTSSQFRSFLETTYRKDAEKMRNIEVLNDLFYNGAGNEGRTFYDAFNAVTDFSSNRSKKTEAGRINYANFGSGRGINTRAMQVALEMAAV